MQLSISRDRGHRRSQSERKVDVSFQTGLSRGALEYMFYGSGSRIEHRQTKDRGASTGGCACADRHHKGEWMSHGRTDTQGYLNSSQV
jgi:hypothetical protein